jgi:CBS domain-containing protein
VARAFEIYRKLGMRHMCVVDQHGMLVGMLTRKDLMTFRISENMRAHKVDAMLRCDNHHHAWLVCYHSPPSLMLAESTLLHLRVLAT